MKTLQDSPPPPTRPEPQPPLPPGIPERHPLVLLLLANARWIWPLIVLTVLIVLSWSDLRSIHYRQFRLAFHSQDSWWLLLAVLLTLANLAVMGLYDVVSLHALKVPARERWWLGTLAFAWSNFLTLGPLAGPAIRFWLYRPFGVSFELLREAIVSIAAGFSAGLFLWTVVGAIPLPGPTPTALALKAGIVSLSAYLLGLLACRIQLWKRFPQWVRGMKIRWFPLFLLGCLDWFLALLVFYAVLRADGLGLASQSAGRLFFWGQAVGLLSLIPGGLGSADTFWISRLDALAASGAAALVIYRIIYYVVPWYAATILLLRRAVHRKVRWAGPARILVSLPVVLSGCMMLVSSATPALARRMVVLRELLPISVLETSHLASAIIGVLLFVLARGLGKGYRDAYRATFFLLLAGAAGSLLKGLDYEEAIVLALTASLLWTHSRLFTLPARTGGTAVAILIPVGLAIFAFTAVGLTAYHGRPFSPHFWQNFAYFGYHARFLRTLSVLFLLGLLIAIYLIWRTPYSHTPPSQEEIEQALARHAAVGRGTTALMVANGDKLIHFWEERGFCLYRTIGRHMIIFSDPSIPEGAERQFMASLLQRAAEIDRILVFYQISAHWIPILHDYGYSFFKLGEEASVDLSQFSIQGNKGKAMRNVLNKFRNDGYRFEVLDREVVHQYLPELSRISQAWLQSKRAREKQFSIGFFDEKYLCRFPCALVRDQSGSVVAFANVLLGSDLHEFSVDLMRYVPECPNGVMDFLFLKLFEWGKEKGYGSFNLGMAPLATVGDIRQARVTERLANILFQHAEHWYNFRGLRQFKEKYDPHWVPRYLAYPAFWMWPQVIANVAAVIAGGWRNVIFPSGAVRGHVRQPVPSA